MLTVSTCAEGCCCSCRDALRPSAGQATVLVAGGGAAASAPYSH
eukprot:COSAG01_NODE_61323_length_290_cov_0.801047_1_plen_43_part_10